MPGYMVSISRSLLSPPLTQLTGSPTDHPEKRWQHAGDEAKDRGAGRGGYRPLLHPQCHRVSTTSSDNYNHLPVARIADVERV